MFSTLAAMAPIAIASRVRSATTDGRSWVNAVVGLSQFAPGIVAAAAPTVSSRMQEMAMPAPAHSPVARREVCGGK